MAEDPVDQDTLAKIVEALAEYGIKEKSVKEAKELTVKLSIKGSLDEDTVTNSLTAIKIDSAWYLIQYYEYGDHVYVSFIF